MNARSTYRFIWFMVAVIVVGAAGLVGYASSCEVEDMVFCKNISEWEHKYRPLDRTREFSTTDQYVYCFLQIRAEDATKVTVEWTTPSGALYHTQSYDLGEPRPGYYTIWSLKPRLAISGTRAATLTGKWRVRVSLLPGSGRTGEFEIVGSTLSIDTFPSLPPSSDNEPATQATEGRENEPNDSAKNSNLIAIDSLVQGETYYHSAELFDQDWYKVILPSNRTYWVCVSFVGTRSLFAQDATGDFKLSLPFQIFEEHDMSRAIVGSLHEHYTTNYEKDTVDCKSAFQVRGPGLFYVRIFSDLSDVTYSIQVLGRLPEWVSE
jgi:hypothetical protein